MKAMTRFSLLVAWLLVLAGPASAAGLLDAPVSFSAQRSVTVNGRTYIGPMYHVPGQERHEQALFGIQQVYILDDESGEGYLILPGLKTYIQYPFPPLLSALVDNDLAKKPLGEETIAGIPAAKYRVDHTAPDGTHGEGFAWISKRGVLMKLDGTMTAPGGHKTTIAMVLSDVKEGPQKPALFAAPQGMTELPLEALAPLFNSIGH
jgi:hypothetical protein